MTIRELINKIKSYPEENMQIAITDVFSWRGSYAEPCCSIEIRNTTKTENLTILYQLLENSFYGYKGGYYFYNLNNQINFERDFGYYSNYEYIDDFIETNKDLNEIKYIFGGEKYRKNYSDLEKFIDFVIDDIKFSIEDFILTKMRININHDAYQTILTSIIYQSSDKNYDVLLDEIIQWLNNNLKHCILTDAELYTFDYNGFITQYKKDIMKYINNKK